jgi:CO/xanthine dehydrogenase Mo-binding subunit
MDIPPLKTSVSRAIGEIANSPTAAAVANAVAEPYGVRITDLPLTAEKVYKALKARNA